MYAFLVEKAQDRSASTRTAPASCSRVAAAYGGPWN